MTLVASLVCLCICLSMITRPTGAIFIHYGFDAFYDGQADSMLHGHWDVAPDAIMGEAFVLHGKYYGYFGFTPALPRMLLNYVFPSGFGRWTRLLMLFWIASVMAAIVMFMEEFTVRSNPFLLVAAVLGSTLFFLCSHPHVYHEAILTGCALALWAYFLFWRYLLQPRLGFLIAACLVSFLSFFARFTVGAGPQILSAFLCASLLVRAFSWEPPRHMLNWLQFPSPREAGRHAALLAISLGVTAATYVSVNHAKFGTWLNPAPFQYQVQYDAARLARIQGSMTHLSNVPFTLSAYFSPSAIKFERSFPWLRLTRKGPSAGSAAKLDLIELYSSIPAAMPALAILSILGIAFAIRAQRRALPLIAASFAGGCLILPHSYISYRYVNDYYPFLLISAVLGAGAAQSISSKPIRSAVTVLIAVAGIWSIVANWGFAIRSQAGDF